MRSPFKKEEPIQPQIQPQTPQETKEDKEVKTSIVTFEQLINIKLDSIFEELQTLSNKIENLTTMFKEATKEEPKK